MSKPRIRNLTKKDLENTGMSDQLSAARLSLEISYADGLIFGASRCPVITYLCKPKTHGRKSHCWYICNRDHKPSIRYAIYENGLFKFLHYVAISPDTRKVLYGDDYRGRRIPIEYIHRRIAAHEVRHRLQGSGAVSHYVPKATAPVLLKLGFEYEPSSHLATEYDAHIVGNIVLKYLTEHNGLIDDFTYRRIITSSCDTLEDILRPSRRCAI